MNEKNNEKTANRLKLLRNQLGLTLDEIGEKNE